MTCPVEVGDTFVWQTAFKGARIGDTVYVMSIRVDEDGVPQVKVSDRNNQKKSLTAEDIQEKVEEGRLKRE